MVNYHHLHAVCGECLVACVLHVALTARVGLVEVVSWGKDCYFALIIIQLRLSLVVGIHIAAYITLVRLHGADCHAVGLLTFGEFREVVLRRVDASREVVFHIAQTSRAFVYRVCSLLAVGSHILQLGEERGSGSILVVTLQREVARLVVGIFRTILLCIVFYGTAQSFGTGEHPFAGLHGSGGEPFAHEDRLEVVACFKHGVHVLHLCRIERTEVERGQIVASTEHFAHGLRLRGVQILQSGDFFKVVEA